MLLKTIENTEVGAFYADSNGYLVFLDRNAIALMSSATPYLFNDDGTNISYQDVSYVYDTDFISNTVQIVPPGFPATVYQDPTSVSRYFERWLYRSDLLNLYTNDVAGQAIYFNTLSRLILRQRRRRRHRTRTSNSSSARGDRANRCRTSPDIHNLNRGTYCIRHGSISRNLKSIRARIGHGNKCTRVGRHRDISGSSLGVNRIRTNRRG